jgi:hypothetical protein
VATAAEASSLLTQCGGISPPELYGIDGERRKKPRSRQRVAFHATVVTALASKGILAASNKRPTWTAGPLAAAPQEFHVPLIPLQWRAMTHSRPPVALDSRGKVLRPPLHWPSELPQHLSKLT